MRAPKFASSARLDWSVTCLPSLRHGEHIRTVSRCTVVVIATLCPFVAFWNLALISMSMYMIAYCRRWAKWFVSFGSVHFGGQSYQGMPSQAADKVNLSRQCDLGG
jgi:hypothetical protein